MKNQMTNQEIKTLIVENLTDARESYEIFTRELEKANAPLCQFNYVVVQDTNTIVNGVARKENGELSVLMISANQMPEFLNLRQAKNILPQVEGKVINFNGTAIPFKIMSRKDYINHELEVSRGLIQTWSTALENLEAKMIEA